MTEHPDDCTIAFVAWCKPCTYTGVERDTVREAAHDCTEHNRKQRHIIGHKGYAHVRVVHHHAPAIPAQGRQS